MTNGEIFILIFRIVAFVGIASGLLTYIGMKIAGRW